MLWERSLGESLWEAVLAAELRELPAELGKVDAILVAAERASESVVEFVSLVLIARSSPLPANDLTGSGGPDAGRRRP